MKIRRILSCAAAAALAIQAGAAFAGPLLSFDGTGAPSGGAAGQLNIGREFTVYNPITINDLGVWDDNGGDGLVASHDVTLFKLSGIGATTGTAIASVTVPAGTAAPVDGQCRFQPLASPVTLTPGYYAVISYGLDSAGDKYGDANALTVNPHYGVVAAGGTYTFTTDPSPAFPGSTYSNYNFAVSSFHYTPEPMTSVYNGSSLIATAGVASGSGNGPLNIGHEFTVDRAISITDLGFWDQGGDGLVNSHNLGLYALDQTGAGATPTLLATAIVQAGTGDPLDAGFRFAGLDVPVTIGPGSYAVIGYGFDVQNGVAGDPYGDGGMTPDPASGIANVYDPYQFVDNQDPATAFPVGHSGTNFAVTSFHYAAVPEPAAVSLLLSMGAALLFVRRKRPLQATR